MQRFPLHTYLFLLFCALMATLSLFLLSRDHAWPTLSPAQWFQFVTVALLAILGSRFTFTWNSISNTSTLAAETAALILLGPWPALAVSITTITITLLSAMKRQVLHRGLFNLSFNIAQTITAFGLSAWLYTSIAGQPDNFDFQSIRHIAAVLVAMCLYCLLSASMAATMVGLAMRNRLLQIVRQFLVGGYFSAVLLAPIGLALAGLISLNPALGFVLLIPISLVHRMGELQNQVTAQAQAAVEAMARLVDERDRDTHQHSQRVARYAVEIGRRMGLPADQLHELRRGCLIHDIGKVVLPDPILKGSEQLSASEWEILKRHPVVGHAMIKDLGPYLNCAAIVLYHHERFDGRGYPERLSGEQIPLLARIAAVADAFDAMTSLRSYRSVTTWEEAIQELVDMAGKQFDPAVVEVATEALTLLKPGRESRPA